MAVAIIVAAGRGTRSEAPGPKQYVDLEGKAILAHAVDTFLAHSRISHVQIVIHTDDVDLYKAALGKIRLGDERILLPVFGGDTRQTSVFNGVKAVAEHPQNFANDTPVLIHDAARPLVDAAVISNVLNEIGPRRGAIAALPVTDSLRQGGSIIESQLPRDDVWRAQTPQGFQLSDILSAHQKAQLGEATGLTDDAAVAIADGVEVAFASGSERNFKITHAADFARAKMLLTEKEQSSMAFEFRSGTGFDVHRFGPGDHVWICGIKLPHTHSLVGHSDADVGLHAITDALLGALGEGDIGEHFSPKDERWAGAASDQFLAFACEMVRERGGWISHLDVTLICEAPRLGPHKPDMRVRVAEIAGVDTSRTSVKATTTERLGFTGRSEGIAAQAIATIALPAQGT